MTMQRWGDSMTRKEIIMQQLQNKMNWLRDNTTYQVAILFLQGSQNYGLDEYSSDYMSDYDAKCFIVPTLEELIENKTMISKTLVMDDGSHIEVKDIRLFSELVKKMNPTYLELLFTPYVLINNKYQIYYTHQLKKELNLIKNDIANANVIKLLKCLEGMIFSKYDHMFKETDSSQKNIEQYGYNPKDFHHLVRLAEMLNEIIRLDGKVNFNSLMSLDFLTATKKTQIKKYKTEPLDVAEAKMIANEYLRKVPQQVKKYNNEEHSINDALLNQLDKIIDEYVFLCVRRDVVLEIKNNNNKMKGAEKRK